MSDTEDFSEPDQLKVYYERTVRGQWVGSWDLSSGEPSARRAEINSLTLSRQACKTSSNA